MTFTINASFDSSVTDLNTVGNAAYNPTLYANYMSAATTAINYFEGVITNSITVNIAFGYGEAGGSPISAGASGQSSSSYSTFTYNQLYTALAATDTTSAVQTAAIATLSAMDPTSGAMFQVNTAQQKALGLMGASASLDGSLGIDASTNFSFNQGSVGAGQEDAVGTFEHEISEVLGRSATGGAGGQYSTLDLFRYTAANGLDTNPIGAAAGVRDEPFVPSYNATAPSYFSYNGTTVTQLFETPTNVAGGADVADWAPSVPNDAFADGGTGTPTPVTATDLQLINVLGYDLNCYLEGTSIATPEGEIAVQNLDIGDRVLTIDGAVKSIVWVGFGRALAPRGRRSAATPIIVRKGALSDNVPYRDLYITKGHSLFLDGVLIPAEFLVNHRSIVWDDYAREVTVYHIELEDHDVLLANGAPAETYRDDENRWLFQNGPTSPSQMPKPPFAPVLTGGPIVDRVWKRLLDRSGAGPIPSLTSEPDIHLIVNRCRIDGTVQPNGALGFRLPPSPAEIRVMSRAAAQDELGLARDPRRLGIALRQIVIWKGYQPTVIEADDSRLSDGFHEHEPDNGFRWTNGDAVLPEAILAELKSACELELHIAATTRYRLAPPSSRRVA